MDFVWLFAQRVLPWLHHALLGVNLGSRQFVMVVDLVEQAFLREVGLLFLGLLDLDPVVLEALEPEVGVVVLHFLDETRHRFDSKIHEHLQHVRLLELRVVHFGHQRRDSMYCIRISELVSRLNYAQYRLCLVRQPWNSLEIPQQLLLILELLQPLNNEINDVFVLEFNYVGVPGAYGVQQLPLLEDPDRLEVHQKHHLVNLLLVLSVYGY